MGAVLVAPPVDVWAGPESAGAVAVGQASYSVPSNALFVAPGGSDGNDGSVSRPLKTVTRAVAVAGSGTRTIVMRAGSYHESVLIPTQARVTLQNYPGEAAWFDGSSPVTSWSRSGSTWSAPWTTRLDRSPTYTRGAADSTAVGWSFINPSFPTAAWPDQVFIGDTALRQVGSAAAVTTGTFFVDQGAGRLVIGSDPSGQTVRSSDLVKALQVVAPGTVIRGIGVRRFSPSVPDFGSISIWRPSVVLENVTVDSSATMGIMVGATDVRLNKVTVTRSGQMGINANEADRLVADGLVISGSNQENFNPVPSAGGFKVTHTRGVTVRNSRITGTIGSTALWLDESTYDATVVGNDITSNGRHGVVVELSAKVTVANNLITGNTVSGLFITNSAGVSVWNNTFADNRRNIGMAQDNRVAANSPNSSGRDKRQPFPDPTMTWILGQVTVSNNVLAQSGAASEGLLRLEDWTSGKSASLRDITVNGNVWNRVASSNPATEILWTSSGRAAGYTTVSAYRTATGQEAAGWALDGRSVLSGSSLTAEARNMAGSVSRPIPSDVAASSGLPSAGRLLGAVR